MTPRYLPLLVGALLFCGVAAGAPTPAHLRAASFGGQLEAMRVEPTLSRVDSEPALIDVHLGDGIFRLRVRGCDTCGVSVTIEVAFRALWQLIKPG